MQLQFESTSERFGTSQETTGRQLGAEPVSTGIMQLQGPSKEGIELGLRNDPYSAGQLAAGALKWHKVCKQASCCCRIVAGSSSS